MATTGILYGTGTDGALISFGFYEKENGVGVWSWSDMGGALATHACQEIREALQTASDDSHHSYFWEGTSDGCGSGFGSPRGGSDDDGAAGLDTAVDLGPDPELVIFCSPAKTV
ncbi:hypothetical protein C8035_v007247 [Colletotrichum spinosum]|uniref:Uncharacterized protein n=1 Tax=Colletotrichum spinosum TaxID=1347390 RepID=A0A4R8QUP7_9PEZI|nr:hypothetical protein C8035_v007247 [Colletotrichum spinosum]